MPRHRGGQKRPPNPSEPPERSANTEGQALEARGPIQLTLEYENNDGVAMLERQQVNTVSILQDT